MAESHWLRTAIGVSAAMCLAMGFGRFSYTIMVPLLVQRGVLTEFEAGYVGASNLFGFMIGICITEWLRQYWKITFALKTMIFISVLALVASSYEVGFWWLAFWRGILGITVGVIMVLGRTIVTAVTPSAFRSLATSVIFSGVGFGIFLSGSAIPQLALYGNSIAWQGVSLFGVCAAGLAIWGLHDLEDGRLFFDTHVSNKKFSFSWTMLLLVHACFAIGLVPHTIYWADFIAREAELGVGAAGVHWVLVGVSSFLGPLVAYVLTQQMGTAWALVIVLAILAVGISAPGLGRNTIVLFVSSVIFGAQPGASALIAARARDISALHVLPVLMRQLIFINGIATAIAGALIPILFDQSESYNLLFWLGGGFMGLGAILSLPWKSFFQSAQS